MATVLAVGDVAGSGTLTVTLTADQPANSTVHLVVAGVTTNTPLADTPHPTALPSDSKEGTWQDGTFAGTNTPVIGAISDGTASGGLHTNVQLGESALRTAGTRLLTGDTVTATWGADNPSDLTLVGVLVAFSNMGTTAVGQFNGGTTPGDDVGVYYSNGDTNHVGAATLNWLADLGSAFMPYPKQTCRLLVGSAITPAASGWVPVNGTKAAEHQSANGLLAVAVHSSSAVIEQSIEPGGSWGSVGSVLVANYQFAGAVGLQSWHKF